METTKKKRKKKHGGPPQAFSHFRHRSGTLPPNTTALQQCAFYRRPEHKRGKPADHNKANQNKKLLPAHACLLSAKHSSKALRKLLPAIKGAKIRSGAVALRALSTARVPGSGLAILGRIRDFGFFFFVLFFSAALFLHFTP